MVQHTVGEYAIARLALILIVTPYLVLLHADLLWDAVIVTGERVRNVAADIARRERIEREVRYCPMHPWQRLYEGRGSAAGSAQGHDELFPTVMVRHPRGIAINRDYLASFPSEADLPYPGRFATDSLDYSPQPAYQGTLVCADCKDISIILRERRAGQYVVLDTVWRYPEFRIYIEPDGTEGEDNEQRNRRGGNTTDSPGAGARL